MSKCINIDDEHGPILINIERINFVEKKYLEDEDKFVLNMDIGGAAIAFVGKEEKVDELMNFIKGQFGEMVNFKV